MRMLLLLALVLFPCSVGANGPRAYCGRTYQTYQSYNGWNQGCSTSGCHASSSQTYTHNINKTTYDGDDYLKGVMLGIAKKKLSHKQQLEFAASLGLTTDDINSAYGNYYHNTLPQYSQQGLAVLGSSQYSKTVGAYGAAANFGSPENDAVLALNLLNRTIDATKEMWNNNIPGLQSIANAHVLGNIEAKRLQAVGNIVASALIASKENPSTTTITQNYRAVTQPNGQVTLIPETQQSTTQNNNGGNGGWVPPAIQNNPQPPQPGNPGPLPENPLPQGQPPQGIPVPGVGSNIVPNALGGPPDVVVQKCNICHADQKKALIGPTLSPTGRLDAIRRVLAPVDSPEHMPKKAATQLTDEEGQVVLRYLTTGQ